MDAGEGDWHWFEIRKWKQLSRPIAPREVGFSRRFTNLFLLEHSTEVPELFLQTEQEYRLYSELKRALNSSQINEKGSNLGFRFQNSLIAFEEGKVQVYREGRICASYSVQEFLQHPNAEFKRICDALCRE